MVGIKISLISIEEIPKTWRGKMFLFFLVLAAISFTAMLLYPSLLTGIAFAVIFVVTMIDIFIGGKEPEVNQEQAKELLKDRLESIILYWEEDKESILKRDEEREKKLREKLFDIGKELKEVIKEDKKLFNQTFVDRLNDFGEDIINFSSQIARRVIVVNEDVERTKRINQKKIEEGDKLAERAKELIKKL